jgi:hypothetical protein
MQKIYPRSPYERLGGYVHLPRLIDKARLHRCGLLHGYKYKTSGFDRRLLVFLGIDGDEFEGIASELSSDGAILTWVKTKGIAHTDPEIEAWNAAMINRQPDTPEKAAQFQRFLAELGRSESSEHVKTYFDLIEFDEGRLNVRRSAFGVQRSATEGS